MRVTCDACETVFTVDDSRIPPEGIKVRCSKCKHVFLVKRESPDELLSELEDFETFHREQMAEGGPGEEERTGETGERLARLPGEQPAGISFEEYMKKEEPGLQLDEAEPTADEPLLPEFEQPEGPLFGEEAPAGEQAGDEATEKPDISVEEPAGISLEEYLSEEEPIPSLEEAELPAEQPELPDEGLRLSDEELIPGELEQPEAPPEEVVVSEEINVQPSLAPGPSEAVAGAPEEAVAEMEETQLSVEDFFRKEMAEEAGVPGGEDSLPSVKDKKFEALFKKKGLDRGPMRRRSSVRAILLLILILLVGAAGYLWWQNREVSTGLSTDIGTTLRGAVKKVTDLWDEIVGSGRGGIELSDLQGREDEIGQHRVYIIEGKVTNASRRTKKYVKLRVVILDQAGNRIKEKVIFGGNVFTRVELEKVSPKFLTGEEILQPKRPKDMVVEPNQTISFMAIFSGLPREGKSFKVEKLEAPGV